MTPVADVDSYPPELCLEHRVSRVSLHIICGLGLEKRDHSASYAWIRWCSKNTQAQPHWSPRSWECGSSGSFPAHFQSWKSPQRCSTGCRAARLAPGWERWWPCCVFWPTDEGAAALTLCRPARCRAVARLSPHLLTETRGVPVFSRLGKLRPRILFTGAEGKRHGCREQRRPIDWGGHLTNFMEPWF